MSPGLVFIEKLQNNDLMMTSFVALRRPNDGFKDDLFHVLRSFLTQILDFTRSMSLNDKLYQS